MRISVFAMCPAFIFSVLAAGQDHPKAELFGGYSLERAAPCGESGSGCNFEGHEGPVTANFNGWNISATGYVTKSWGLTADFAGHYGMTNAGFGGSANYSNYTYMFGPSYAVHLLNATPFVHGLFGGVSWRSPSNLVQYNAIAWAVGGGLDVNANQHVAIRIAQFDYQGTRVPSASKSTLGSGWRYSLGVVLKF